MGEFEKDIRDMFEDLELQIDTDALWAGIEKKLDKKDRRFPVWWIIAPVLLLAAIIIYSTIGLNTGIEKTQTYNPAQQKNSKINNNGQQKNHQKGLKETNFNIPDKKDAKKQEQKKNIDTKQQDIATTYSNEKSQEIAISSLSSGNASKEDNTSGNNGKRPVIFEEKPFETIVISTIPDKFDLLNTSGSIIYKGKFADYFDRKPITKQDHWSNSMDFSLGFALVNKELMAKTGDFDNYLNKRIATENYLEAFSSNFDYNINHSSGFFISTGIHYTQIDERFQDVDSIDIHKENQGISKEVQNGDGTISYLRGQKEVVKHIVWDKIIYNYYSFVEIPVIVGYRFDINKLSVELNSGLSYNLLFLKRGQIIGTEGFPVDIANEKNIFKNRSGISFIAGMKVLFPIKKRLFFFEPNIKYNLQDITTDEYPLKQRYFNYGLKLGYRYKF